MGRAAWYWDKKGAGVVARRVNWGWPSGLLAQLELRGKVVTGDALYAQRELSLRVLELEQGGDYFWALV